MYVCVFVQGACDLLRKVMRMLFLLKRLKTQMQGGNKELTKMAQTFAELGGWSCWWEVYKKIYIYGSASRWEDCRCVESIAAVVYVDMYVRM